MAIKIYVPIDAAGWTGQRTIVLTGVMSAGSDNIIEIKSFK